MNQLEFIKKQRNRKLEQEYWDFVIGEKPLFDYLRLSDMDLITPFGWGSKDLEHQLLKEFCLESLPTLDSERIMFYVCPECGDIGCGTITGRISENTKGQIEWNNFGYENNHEGIIEIYDNLFFCFEKAEYLQIFQNLKVKL